MDTNEKGRPRQGDLIAQQTSEPVVSVVGDTDIPAYLDAGYVLLVRVTSVLRGTSRRRVYFNQPSATNAIHRAESRGDVATVALAKLVPVANGSGL